MNKASEEILANGLSIAHSNTIAAINRMPAIRASRSGNFQYNYKGWQRAAQCAPERGGRVRDQISQVEFTTRANEF